jgi:putative transposase
MPRPRRTAIGGLVYHVLNRANGRRRIFEKPGDYAAFERLLADIQERTAMRVLAWCLMPNHWHLVLWPREDGDLSTFVRLVCLTHAQRWHAHRGSAGTGHLYQGRFKSFVVQADAHLLTVCRYVEANALRAALVARAEHWRWSSLRVGASGRRPAISAWPVPKPGDWLRYVNEHGTRDELDRLRTCNRRGRPYGDRDWMARKVEDLQHAQTLRPRGRPKKVPDTFSG